MEPPAIPGRFTVSMSSIDVSGIPGGRRDLPAQIPTALIGRLAVDEPYQRQGLGELLLSDALRRICQAAEHVAAHAIVLDALDDDAKQLYERYGFLELSDDPLRLFLPLATARGLFPAEESDHRTDGCVEAKGPNARSGSSGAGGLARRRGGISAVTFELGSG